MSRQQQAIAVLGAGSWGTALALLLARSGRPVHLWGHNPEHIAALSDMDENRRYLPGIPLPDNLLPIAALQGACKGVDDILIVVPSHAFRTTLTQLKPYLHDGQRIAWACKGLEQESAKLLHEVFDEELGSAYKTVVVSGPTFAREVAEGLPTAVTVASDDPEFATEFAATLHDENFRAYTSSDVIGVELGGAIKNVLAIAAGIADGLGFGANTRAALVTRGLHEMMRLGVALGGQQETFMGLAGLGDLLLTCTDNQSRNRRFGLALGKGLGVDEARASIDQVIEGIDTTREVMRRAEQSGVEMPICGQVAKVLFEGVQPKQAVHTLLSREQRPES